MGGNSGIFWIYLFALGVAMAAGNNVFPVHRSLPLIRTKSGFHRMLELFVEKIAQNASSFLRHPRPPHPRPWGNETVPLYKYLDSEFYGEIGLGQPKQNFKMILDTTWSDSWVTSAKCPVTVFPCGFRNKYDSSKSFTYVEDGIPFNVSKLVGFSSKDTLVLGHTNVTNQTFYEITDMPFDRILSTADGTLGLSIAPGSSNTFFQNLIQQGKINQAVFSVYLNREESTDHGGSFFFGGSDSKHYNGSFTYVNVINATEPTGWIFPVDSVKLILSKKKSILLCPKGCNAMPDTSTTVISGPPEDVKKINTMIKATPLWANRFMVPCDYIHQMPKIAFVIQNKAFNISGEDYVQKITYVGIRVCLSAFTFNKFDAPFNDMWLLGGAFLSRYYTEFNQQQKVIGFATRK